MQTNTNSRIRQIVLGGLFASLVLLATWLLRIPYSAQAYFHLGEAVIFATAAVFGRWYGGLAGAIGAALADILGGYWVWAPITFVIKGLEGYVVGTIGHRAPPARTLFAMLAGAGILVIGYGVSAYLLYGTAAVLPEFIGDLAQGGFGVTVGFIVSRLLLRATSQYRPNEG